MTIWNAASYTMTINARGTTTTKQFESPISADQVKTALRELGVDNFTVYDSDGDMINPEAFPYSGNIEVREYNAAKGGFTPSTPIY